MTSKLPFELPTTYTLDDIPEDARDFVRALLEGSVSAYALVFDVGREHTATRWSNSLDGQPAGNWMTLLGAIDVVKQEIMDSFFYGDICAGLDDSEDEDE